MSEKSYHSMKEYFDPRRSLKDRFDELSDPSAIPNHEDPKVNAAVMGLVAKYLCDYLCVTSIDITTIQRAVKRKIKDIETEEMQAVSLAGLEGEVEGTSDTFGLQCLGDVSTTSALVKEIAFNDKFEKPDQFMGVDLGSGTGILGCAIAIAATRQQVRRPTVALLDSQKNALDNSMRVLSQIDKMHFHPLQCDLRNPNVYKIFGPPIWVQYWVSETFGHTTPEITRINPKEIQWGNGGAIDFEINGALDPFMNVLENLMRYSPHFYDRVTSGKTALFPDPINGNFLPSDGGGRILLKTGPKAKPVPYREIRKEFESFEDFKLSNIRWG